MSYASRLLCKDKFESNQSTKQKIFSRNECSDVQIVHNDSKSRSNKPVDGIGYHIFCQKGIADSLTVWFSTSETVPLPLCNVISIMSLLCWAQNPREGNFSMLKAFLGLKAHIDYLLQVGAPKSRIIWWVAHRLSGKIWAKVPPTIHRYFWDYSLIPWRK